MVGDCAYSAEQSVFIDLRSSFLIWLVYDVQKDIFKYLQQWFSAGILQQTGCIALCQWSSYITVNQTVPGRKVVSLSRFLAAALVTEIRYMKMWKWLQHPKVKWGLREMGLWSSAESSLFCIKALLSHNTALSLSQQGVRQGSSLRSTAPPTGCQFLQPHTISTRLHRVIWARYSNSRQW